MTAAETPCGGGNVITDTVAPMVRLVWLEFVRQMVCRWSEGIPPWSISELQGEVTDGLLSGPKIAPTPN